MYFKRIVTNDTLPALSADIRMHHGWAMDYLAEAAAMTAIQNKIMPVVHEVGQIIAGTRPLVVPMIWSTYPERLWDPKFGCIKPCVTVPVTHVSWNKTDWKSNRSGGFEILKDAVTIHVVCEPCWEAYKRWGWEMIDSFYSALRALRYAYDIKWEDISEVKSAHFWQQLKYHYISKSPIEEIITPIEEVEQYGETINQRITKIRVAAVFTLPNTPENERNAANCHVVEEEVEETVKKKIRRIKCV